MACVQVTAEDLQAAVAAVGEFGADNRAGIAGTLHRISGIRNRRGAVIGLTCRVGRAVTGHTDMLCDLVEGAAHAHTQGGRRTTMRRDWRCEMRVRCGAQRA